MKIALIHYSSPPIIGGVESVMGYHAKLMANGGHEVRIIAGAGSVFDRRIQLDVIPRISSQHTTVLDAKKYLDKGIIPDNFEALVKELKEKLSLILERVDIVIAHNVCSLHKNLPLTAALHEISQENESPQFVLWHHDLVWTSGRYKGELHAGYPWDLLRTAWRGVKQITISELRRNEISDVFGLSSNEIEIIPSGLDIAELSKFGTTARRIVNDFGLLDADPFVLLPVRITKRKNIEFALRVISSLENEMPMVKLVVTGPIGAHNPANSQYFDELKTMSRDLALDDRVIYLAEKIESFLPNEVIHDLYRVADALILPSLEEGFGIPMLEAGFLRVPIFCSDIPTLMAIGGEEANYFRLSSDPTEVAAQIANVLRKDPNYRLRARIKRNYTWQGIYEKQIVPLLEGVHVP